MSDVYLLEYRDRILNHNIMQLFGTLDPLPQDVETPMLLQFCIQLFVLVWCPRTQGHRKSYFFALIVGLAGDLTWGHMYSIHLFYLFSLSLQLSVKSNLKYDVCSVMKLQKLTKTYFSKSFRYLMVYSSVYLDELCLDQIDLLSFIKGFLMIQ
jgi:hypothetical protein